MVANLWLSQGCGIVVIVAGGNDAPGQVTSKPRHFRASKHEGGCCKSLEVQEHKYNA